jgi:xanthine dehydrogenase small subunit
MGARPGVSKLTGAAEALDDVADDVLDYRVGDTSFLSPTTVDGLLRARRERPRARVIAGGTDVVPAVPGRGELPLEWIWTGRVAGFDAVVVDPGMLVIGGGASVEAAWAALAGRWPQLVTGWQRFASPAIRENGTLAGNLVTASPIGDSAPVLLALDARVVVSSVDGERTLPLSDFFAGYRRTALSPDEIVVRIEVPLPEPARDVRMYKVARRFDNDIATVSVAVSLLLDGDAIEQVRVAFGGMSAVPGRAGSVEQVLAGRRWDRDALVAAQEAVALDVSPMSDHRGSAEYRMSVARGLLERWWLQTRPDHPLPVTATEVWSAL